MAGTIRTVVKTTADNSGFKDAGAGADSFATKMGNLSTIAGGFALGQLATQIPGQLMEMSKQAAALELQAKKAATVFSDELPAVQKWAAGSASAMGLTGREATSLAANMADLLIPMGMTRDAAAEMAEKTIGLSGALSEWSGGSRSAADVAVVLQKAFLGERDGLKELGISISEADVSARLLANGQNTLTGSALEQAKAQATMQLVFEKSTDAQNAFAEGADSAARKSAEMTASLHASKEALSQGLGPVIAEGTQLLAAGLVPALQGVSFAAENIPGSTAGIALGMGAIALAAGPVVGTLAGVAGSIAKIKEEGATAGQKLTGIAVGLTAVAIGADLILQKTTGHGLVETAIGNVDSLEASADAVRDLTDALNDLLGADKQETNARKLTESFNEVTAAGEELDQAFTNLRQSSMVGGGAFAYWGEKTRGVREAMSGIPGILTDVESTANKAEGAFQAQLETTLRLNPAVTDLWSVYSQMSPAAQEMADKTWHVTTRMAALAATLPGANTDMSQFGLLAGEAAGGGTKAASAFDLIAESSRNAKGQLEPLNKTIDRTIDLLSRTDETDAIAFSIGQLEFAIARLKASDEGATEAGKAQIKSLEDQIQTLQNRTGVTDAAVASIESSRGQMEKALGEKNFGELLADMQAAGATAPQVATSIANIAAALSTFKSGDIGASVGMFAQIKADLGPDSPGWKELEATVGPSFANAVVAGMTGDAVKGQIDQVFGASAATAIDAFGRPIPAGAKAATDSFGTEVTSGLQTGQEAIDKSFADSGRAGLTAFEAEAVIASVPAIFNVGSAVVTETAKQGDAIAGEWSKLGSGAIEGMEAGLVSKANALAGTIKKAMRDLLGAAKEEAGHSSPAKKWIPLGEGLIEGIEVGLIKESSNLERRVAEVVGSAQGTANATIIAGVPVTAGGGGQGWILNSDGSWSYGSTATPQSPAALGRGNPGTLPIGVPNGENNAGPQQPNILTGLPNVAGLPPPPAKLPWVEVAKNVWWDPNPGGTFHNGDLGAGAVWDGTTLGTQYGANEVYRDDKGVWRSMVDDRIVTNADGSFMNDEMRKSAQIYDRSTRGAGWGGQGEYSGNTPPPPPADPRAGFKGFDPARDMPGADAHGTGPYGNSIWDLDAMWHAQAPTINGERPVNGYYHGWMNESADGTPWEVWIQGPDPWGGAIIKIGSPNAPGVERSWSSVVGYIGQTREQAKAKPMRRTTSNGTSGAPRGIIGTTLDRNERPGSRWAGGGGGSAAPTINLYLSAMDSQDIIRRGPDIAEALSQHFAGRVA